MRRLQSLKGVRRQLPPVPPALWMILPSVAVIGLILSYPVMRGVYLSFFRDVGFQFTEFTFWGLKNYVELFTDDPLFFKCLRNSFVLAMGTVAGSYVVGLSLALLLNREIRGRSIYRALLFLPWVMPGVAMALTWSFMLNDQFGIINLTLQALGLVKDPILWLARPRLAMLSLLVVSTWQSYPFLMILLLAAIQSIPGELYEAARIDGASAMQLLWHITLPLIRPVSVIASLLCFIWSFNNFGLPYLLTKGGPAYATEVLATLAWRKAFERMQVSYGAAVGTIMLVVMLVVAFFYMRWTFRGVEE